MKGITRNTLSLMLAATAAVGGVASAAPSTPANSQGEILGAGSATAIEDSYIVALRGDTQTSAQSIADRYDGNMGHTYGAALKGFSVTMSEAQARKLAADPAVESVTQNQTVKLPETKSSPATQAPPASWGLDRVDQRDLPLDGAYTPGNDGANVTAYVIDTGIRTTHQDFGGRASHGWDFVDNDQDATDCHGHGTHVAANIVGNQFGVAKAAKVKALRALDCEGSGSLIKIIDAIDWVTANAEKPAVVNMSLGVGGATVRILDNAIRNSVKSGLTYAVSAGNETAEGCATSPGHTQEAITVGATDINDANAQFSNFGPCVDTYAPGKDITSAWITDDAATHTISGTSMASPHAAGAAVLYLSEHPEASPQEVRDNMVLNASTTVSNPPAATTNRLLYAGSEPAPPAPEPCTAESTTPTPIGDGQTITSEITVSGCGRNGSPLASFAVDVAHTAQGNMQVELIGPDGDVRTVEFGSPPNEDDNLNRVYSVDLSGVNADGKWQLRIIDRFQDDESGTLNKWSLNI